MPKLKLTKRAVEAFEPAPPGERRFYRDTDVPGLGVRVTERGVKTFQVYRKVKGQPVRHTLGRFPAMSVEQARRAATEYNGDIAKGLDPHAERKRVRRAGTLADLYRSYRDEYLVPRAKRTRMPESLYRCHLSRHGQRKIAGLTRTEIKQWHQRIGRTAGHVTANRVHQLLRAMLNWAIDEELIAGPNPANGIKRYPERARERFLHPDEMPRFLKALKADPNPDFRDFVLICLLTGARKSNVLAMRWEDVNLERATWTIPQTKSGTPHTVPLVEQALKVLNGRMPRAESPWVFPGPGKTGHLVEPKKPWAALLKRAEISDLKIHDLRRTLGSWQVATGATLHMVGRTLAHASPQATAVYARLHIDPVREAIEAATRAMQLSEKEVVSGEKEVERQ